jgi:hypothetical protein
MNVRRIIERARALTARRRQLQAQERFVEDGRGLYAYSPDRMRRVSLGDNSPPEVWNGRRWVIERRGTREA